MFRQVLILFVIITALLSSNNALAFVDSSEQSWVKMYVYGREAFELKQYREAENTLNAALEAAAGNRQREILTLDALELLYEEQDNYPAQEKTILSSLRLMQSPAGYRNKLAGIKYLKLSALNHFMKRLDKAEQYAFVGLSILRNTCGPLSQDVAIALNNLGWIEYERGKWQQAENHFRRALYVFGKTVGEKNILYGLTANNLARLYEMKKENTAAYFWYVRTKMALDASLRADDPLVAEVTGCCRRLRPTHGRRSIHQKKKPIMNVRPSILPYLAQEQNKMGESDVRDRKNDDSKENESENERNIERKHNINLERVRNC